MTDLDVALRLRLINGLSGPAKTAAKDLENIKRAAARLNGVGGGSFAANFGKAYAASAKLSQSLGAVQISAGAASVSLQRLRGRFAGDFGKAYTASAKLSQGLGAVQIKAGAAANFMGRVRVEASAGRIKQATGGALNLAGAYDRVAQSAKRAAQASAAVRKGGGAGPSRDANGRFISKNGSGAHGGGKGAAEGQKAIGATEAATLGGLASRYGGRFLAGAAVVGSVHSTVKNFADLETSMKQLAITANISDKEVWGDIERFRAIAPAVRSNAKELTDSAYQMVNAGIDYRTAMAAAVPVAKTAKAAFADQGDVTQAGIAVVNNLKIRAEELQDAFDRMAFAGKEGQVELKNMAKVLPEVAASGANLGMKGLTGLTDIAAALEIVRKVTPSADEAANRLQNLFEKITADETTKQFNEKGVDLEKKIKEGAKKGLDALQVVLAETKRLTKGDPFRINELFGDMQARAAISALLKFEGEYNEMRARIARGSKGTIDRDFERATDRVASNIERLDAAWDRFKGRVGETFAPGATKSLEALSDLLDKIEEKQKTFERAQQHRLAYENEKRAPGEAPAEAPNYASDPLGAARFNAQSLWDWYNGRIGGTAEQSEAMGRLNAFNDATERLAAARKRLEAATHAQNSGNPSASRLMEGTVAQAKAEVERAEAQLEAIKQRWQEWQKDLDEKRAEYARNQRVIQFGQRGGVDIGDQAPAGAGVGNVPPGLLSFPGVGPRGFNAKKQGAELEKAATAAARLKGALTPELAASASTSMAGYNSALKLGTDKAVETALAAAQRIKDALSFTATPTIAPRISAPPAGGAPPASPGGKRGASNNKGGGGNVIIQSAQFHGVRDMAGLHKQALALADRAARGKRDGALHDVDIGDTA